MHRFVEFAESFLLRSLVPFLIIAAAGVGGLFVALFLVSVIERHAGRPTPFELQLPGFGAAWVPLLALLLILDGLILAKAALAEAQIGRRRGCQGYEIRLPLPVAPLASLQVTYAGSAILLFYALRQVIGTTP